jgi:flavin-binding protein dodecin
MADPYKSQTESGDGLLNRFVGKGKRSAIREIENLLAEAERVSDISAQQLTAVADANGVDIAEQLHTPRRSLYRRYLEYCLVDFALSDEESTDLAHLRAILRIQEEDAARIHDEVSRTVYGDAVDRVLTDYQLDSEEAEFLQRLRTDLDLPEPLADSLLDERSKRARNRYLGRAVSDNVLFQSEGTVLELKGDSETGLEDAIRAALDEACRAVPKLCWAQVDEIRAELKEGRIARWHVRVNAQVNLGG